ncbi:FmdB family zinc ribbon protein [Pseudodesulfovibrio sp.]|uniref:FmdB family zinc ribbon protein n=1 Tax=unclassified Pseudodesulfovibrio TaxID=2661612 RepID=UPI003B00096C
MQKNEITGEAIYWWNELTEKAQESGFTLAVKETRFHIVDADGNVVRIAFDLGEADAWLDGYNSHKHGLASDKTDELVEALYERNMDNWRCAECGHWFDPDESAGEDGDLCPKCGSHLISEAHDYCEKLVESFDPTYSVN